MKGNFALNCTIPPNIITTVLIPVPGIASPIIMEGTFSVQYVCTPTCTNIL